MIQRKPIFVIFLVLAASFLVKAQTDGEIKFPLNCSEAETPKADSALRNQRKLKVSVIAGKTFEYRLDYKPRILEVFDEACLALFTESDQKLVAKTESGDDGDFTFGNLPEGFYRLIVYHKLNFVKIANIPIEVLKSTSENKHKKILVYLIDSRWVGESFVKLRSKPRKIEKNAVKKLQ